MVASQVGCIPRVCVSAGMRGLSGCAAVTKPPVACAQVRAATRIQAVRRGATARRALAQRLHRHHHAWKLAHWWRRRLPVLHAWHMHEAAGTAQRAWRFMRRRQAGRAWRHQQLELRAAEAQEAEFVRQYAQLMEEARRQQQAEAQAAMRVLEEAENQRMADAERSQRQVEDEERRRAEEERRRISEERRRAEEERRRVEEERQAAQRAAEAALQQRQLEQRRAAEAAKVAAQRERAIREAAEAQARAAEEARRAAAEQARLVAEEARRRTVAASHLQRGLARLLAAKKAGRVRTFLRAAVRRQRAVRAWQAIRSLRRAWCAVRIQRVWRAHAARTAVLAVAARSIQVCSSPPALRAAFFPVSPATRGGGVGGTAIVASTQGACDASLDPSPGVGCTDGPKGVAWHPCAAKLRLQARAADHGAVWQAHRRELTKGS